MSVNEEPQLSLALTSEARSPSRVLGTKSAVVGSSVRSPLNNITNKRKDITSPKQKLKGCVTPSRYSALEQLDDDAGWQDRAEVVTRLDHDAYRTFAKEVLEELVNKALADTNRSESTNEETGEQQEATTSSAVVGASPHQEQPPASSPNATTTESSGNGPFTEDNTHVTKEMEVEKNDKQELTTEEHKQTEKNDKQELTTEENKQTEKNDNQKQTTEENKENATEMEAEKNDKQELTTETEAEKNDEQELTTEENKQTTTEMEAEKNDKQELTTEKNDKQEPTTEENKQTATDMEAEKNDKQELTTETDAEKNDKQEPTTEKNEKQELTTKENKQTTTEMEAEKNDKQEPAIEESKHATIETEIKNDEEAQSEDEKSDEFFDTLESVEDITVPSKGSQLDMGALDVENVNPFKTKSSVMNSPDKQCALDVENFDPFKTKSSVMNSPDKQDILTVISKSSEPSIINPDFQKEDSKQTVDKLEVNTGSLQHTADSGVVKDSALNSLLGNSPKKENMVVEDAGLLNIPKEKTPQKGTTTINNPGESKVEKPATNLDLLKQLDDPNFDPFKSTSTVDSSPEKNSDAYDSEDDANVTIIKSKDTSGSDDSVDVYSPTSEFKNGEVKISASPVVKPIVSLGLEQLQELKPSPDCGSPHPEQSPPSGASGPRESSGKITVTEATKQATSTTTTATTEIKNGAYELTTKETEAERNDKQELTTMENKQTTKETVTEDTKQVTSSTEIKNDAHKSTTEESEQTTIETEAERKDKQDLTTVESKQTTKENEAEKKDKQDLTTVESKLTTKETETERKDKQDLTTVESKQTTKENEAEKKDTQDLTTVESKLTTKETETEKKDKQDVTTVESKQTTKETEAEKKDTQDLTTVESKLTTKETETEKKDKQDLTTVESKQTTKETETEKKDKQDVTTVESKQTTKETETEKKDKQDVTTVESKQTTKETETEKKDKQDLTTVESKQTTKEMETEKKDKQGLTTVESIQTTKETETEKKDKQDVTTVESKQTTKETETEKKDKQDLTTVESKQTTKETETEKKDKQGLTTVESKQTTKETETEKKDKQDVTTVESKQTTKETETEKKDKQDLTTVESKQTTKETETEKKDKQDLTTVESKQTTKENEAEKNDTTMKNEQTTNETETKNDEQESIKEKVDEFYDTVESVEEISVSNKGYQLDLDVLDNFDPFKIKTSVMNSPSRLDDLNFDPFKITTAVANSPEKKEKNMTVPVVEIKETPKPAENKSETLDIFDPYPKATSCKAEVKVNDKPLTEIIGEQLAVLNKSEENGSSDKDVAEKAEGSATTEEDQEIAVPSKGYQLDFLEALNIYDPFTTKASVMNSPDTKKTNYCDNKNLSQSATTNEKQGTRLIDIDPFTTKASVMNSPDTKKTNDSENKNIAQSATTDNKREQETETNLSENTKQDIPPAPLKSSSTDLELPKVDDKNDSEIADNRITADQNISEGIKGKPDVCQKVRLSPKRKFSEIEDTEEPESLEEESLPVPSKGYNLDFLDQLDEPSLNPFQTKSAVNNSPDKESTTKDTSVTNVEKKKEIQKQEAVKPSFKNQSETIDIVSPVPDITTFKPEKLSSPNSKKVVDTVETKTVSEKSEAISDAQDPVEEEIPIPSKGYNLDFLNQLDDPNVNPFQTKSAVNNSPDKGSAAKDTLVKNVEKKEIKKQDTVKPSKTQPATVDVVNPIPEITISKSDKLSTHKSKKMANQIQTKTTPAKSEAISEAQDPAEEIPVPSKGYNLDFLDQLDDPNVNPFLTKTAVNNSPDKGSASKSVLVAIEEKKKTETKKQDAVKPASKPKNGKPKKLSPSKSKQVADKPQAKIVLDKSKDISEAQDPTEEEVPVPSKGYNLDFLDQFDDPNVNPFQTKSAVNNSPDKGSASKNESIANEEKKNTETKKHDAVKRPSKPKNGKPKKRSLSKSKQVADKPQAKTVPDKSKEISVEQEEDIPVPSKGYNLDFLDQLDDPNVNPFQTKTAVNNSPDKGSASKNESVVNREKENEEAKKQDAVKPPFKPKNRKPSISAKSKQAAYKPQAKTVPEKNKDISEAEVIVVPSKGYQLDSLEAFDKDKCDPFQTKFSIMNSPETKKTATNEKPGIETSDNNPFKTKSSIMNSPDNKKTANIDDKCSTKPNDKTKTESLDIDPFKTKSSCMNFPDTKTTNNNNKCLSQSAPLINEIQPSDLLSQDPFTTKSSLVTDTNMSVDCMEVGVKQMDSTWAKSGGRQMDAQNPDDEFISGVDFFGNADDLDMLGQHGTEGDRVNLARNSLFVKFDPLVGGRPSMAPFIAQQFCQRLKEEDQDDPRRNSGLISFSPSPKKRMHGVDRGGDMTAFNLDNTVSEDSPANNTTVLSGGGNNTSFFTANNTTILAANNTIINSSLNATVMDLADITMMLPPPVPEERMITERCMMEKIKKEVLEKEKKMIEKEKKMELIMQDTLLRKSREHEEVNKAAKQKIESLEQKAEAMEQEYSVVVTTLEDDNANLRQDVSKWQTISGELKVVCTRVASQWKEEKATLERLWEEEKVQYQEDSYKQEAIYIDLVKKYDRQREVNMILKRNEEGLGLERKRYNAELEQKKCQFKEAISDMEEKYQKCQQESEAQHQKDEQDLKRVQLVVRKAELEIISLKETVAKKTAENQRLNDLIDEMSSNY